MHYKSREVRQDVFNKYVNILELNENHLQRLIKSPIVQILKVLTMLKVVHVQKTQLGVKLILSFGLEFL